jgi:hypothetical protein
METTADVKARTSTCEEKWVFTNSGSGPAKGEVEDFFANLINHSQATRLLNHIFQGALHHPDLFDGRSPAE